MITTRAKIWRGLMMTIVLLIGFVALTGQAQQDTLTFFQVGFKTGVF
jgi:hypothetical protein